MRYAPRKMTVTEPKGEGESKSTCPTAIFQGKKGESLEKLSSLQKKIMASMVRF